MSFFNKELQEKAQSFSVPYLSPRTLKEKLTVFKAAPAMFTIGIIFDVIFTFLLIMFFSLGIFDDFLISDWQETEGVLVGWIKDSGEKINNHNIPAVIFEYSTQDSEILRSQAKVTIRNKEYELEQIVLDNELEKIINSQRLKTVPIEYSKSKPKKIRIKGMTTTAMPVWFGLLPVILGIIGFSLILGAFKKRSNVQHILENGIFAVGNITEKKITYQRSRHNRKSANSVQIYYEFSVDGERIESKFNVPLRRDLEFSEGQEIPVLYIRGNPQKKSVTPLAYNIEFRQNL